MLSPVSVIALTTRKSESMNEIECDGLEDPQKMRENKRQAKIK